MPQRTEVPHNAGAINANSTLHLDLTSGTDVARLKSVHVDHVEVIHTGSGYPTLRIDGVPYTVTPSGPASLSVGPRARALIIETDAAAIATGTLRFVFKGTLAEV